MNTSSGRGRVARVSFVLALGLLALYVILSLDDETSSAAGCLVAGSWCDPATNSAHASLILPKPVRAPDINTLNSYVPVGDAKSGGGAKTRSNFIVVIRSYSGFLNATRQLLENLDQQNNLAERGIALHAVILSTDLNSSSLIQKEVTTAGGLYQSSRFRHVTVHHHAFRPSVYEDNCCQLTQMCSDEKYKDAWEAHLQRRYGNYKPESLRAKRVQFCSLGNNLLHYVLCDAALRYIVAAVPAAAANSTFLAFTNGDNVYSRDFVWRMVDSAAGGAAAAGTASGSGTGTGAAGTGAGTAAAASGAGAAGAAAGAAAAAGGGGVLPAGGWDLAMCDYLERGVGVVRSALRVNQMDLGATVYRVGALRRLGGLGYGNGNGAGSGSSGGSGSGGSGSGSGGAGGGAGGAGGAGAVGGTGFLDAMPAQAWPTNYYAADAEFVLYLVRARGARWGRVPEVLFTHWR